MPIDKQKIFNQIDTFNNAGAVKGGKGLSIADTYLYVTKSLAEDRSDFLKFIIESDELFKRKLSKKLNVLDLAFGSGNLTSHLILDNEIDFSKITFNDKNSEQVNKNIIDFYESKAIITTNNFFESKTFDDNEKIDFLVFNPQVGGSGDEFKIKTNITLVTTNLDLKKYLEENFKSDEFDTDSLTITYDEDTKSILIESKELTKKVLMESIKIEIFNYYDLNFKGKTGDATVNSTDIVRFRKSFDRIFNENGILVYYGDEAHFKVLFADFNHVNHYWTNPKHFFIATKEKESFKKCYERINSKFNEIPNCEKIQNNKSSDVDLSSLEDGIGEELVKLQLADNSESIIVVNKSENVIKNDCEDNSELLKLEPRNKIFYGAPGTGKSYELRNTALNDLKFSEKNVKRVTFHPSYSYQQFVGSYKPSPIYKALNKEDDKLFESDKVTELTGTEKREPLIDYKFVPGPFLELLVNALLAKQNKTNCNYMLIIEEINRANVASVFGDVFQLLDRNDSGESEYSITFNTDIRNFLRSKNIESENIKLPENFFIWATMNNADQGVMPLDSAFKRRWSFEYIGIDKAEKKEGFEHSNRVIKFRQNKYFWNSFRKAINNKLKANNVNEDKFLGFYYMNENELKSEEVIKNKLLLYLREDVLRHNPSVLFHNNLKSFSDIVDKYDDKLEEDKNILLIDWDVVDKSESQEKENSEQ